MLDKIIFQAVEKRASDIHLTENLPPVLRIDGQLTYLRDYEILDSSTLRKFTEKLLGGNFREYQEKRSFDFSFSTGNYRFRGHIFKQRGTDAIVLRLIPTKIPDISELNLPEAVRKFTLLKNGLVLVTGTTGSGKSTTLASLINEINRTQKKHIITIEDPIEFVHEHNKSIINQREVGSDVLNFANAVRSAMREDPDILLVGEMRDLETIQNTITIAETGHLAFATLHTKSAAETINRIIDVFPPGQQQQIRLQLSSVLQGVISQTLLPKIGGGRVPACELMIVTDGIRSLIREQSPPSAIEDQIQMNYRKLGSQTFQQSLANLYVKGLISYEVAIEHTPSEEVLRHMIERQRK